MNDNNDDGCYDDGCVEDDGCADAGFDDGYDDGGQEFEQDEEDDCRGGADDECEGNGCDDEGYDQGGDSHREGQVETGDYFTGHDQDPNDRDSNDGPGDEDGRSSDGDGDYDGPREEYQHNGLNDHRQGDGCGAFIHTQSQQQDQCASEQGEDVQEPCDEEFGCRSAGHQGQGRGDDEDTERCVPQQYRDAEDIGQDDSGCGGEHQDGGASQGQPYQQGDVDEDYQQGGDDERADDSRGYQEFEAYNTIGVYNTHNEYVQYSPSGDQQEGVHEAYHQGQQDEGGVDS